MGFQVLALHGQRDIGERFGVQQLIEHRQQIALVVVPSQAEPLRGHCRRYRGRGGGGNSFVQIRAWRQDCWWGMRFADFCCVVKVMSSSLLK